MLTFSYSNAWTATYQGDLQGVAWLKRVFTYTDMKDIRHKQRLGYFPSYCTIDTANNRMSHGQVIHAIRQAKADGVQVTISDPNRRYLVETGPLPPNFLPEVTAYDYQLLCAQIAVGAGHGLVVMGTGGGKTVVIGMCLKILATMTDCQGILILIYSKDLLNQTAKRMLAYGIPSDDIGVIHSDVPPEKQVLASQKRIVLSTHLSITKYHGVIDRTRYALVDEGHHAIGPLYSALFGKLPNLINVLGFTATPWDNEGEKQKMLAIYGQVLVNIPFSFLMKRGVVMKPEVYFIKIHYPDRDIKLISAMDWREAKKQFILEDRNRNLLPIVVLKKFGGRMLVIYEDLNHGKALRDLYKEQGYETRLAEGESSTKNRESAIQWFEKKCEPGQHGKVLLASKIFNEGVDIKGGCDICYVVGAGQDISKVTQQLGRAARLNGTNRMLFFDNQDSNHPTLSKWSGVRRRAIEDLGLTVKVITLEEFVDLK